MYYSEGLKKYFIFSFVLTSSNKSNMYKKRVWKFILNASCKNLKICASHVAYNLSSFVCTLVQFSAKMKLGIYIANELG